MEGAVGIGFGTFCAWIMIAVVCGGLYGCPQYGVYTSRLDGEAELAKAEYSKRVAVQTAQANLDAASLKAQTDVARAKGVAEANHLIAEGLGGPEGYLRWKYIEMLQETAESPGKNGHLRADRRSFASTASRARETAMISPSYEYDHGRVTLTFPACAEPFEASMASERHLAARGFSVGRRQGSDPRGILFGDVDIQKWRNLRELERDVLHGQMTGDGRIGPITIEIFAHVPDEVRRAIVAAPTKQGLGRPDKALRALGIASDAVALATLLFCLGSVAWVSTHPIWSRPPASGKITLRAISEASTIEARR